MPTLAPLAGSQEAQAVPHIDAACALFFRWQSLPIRLLHPEKPCGSEILTTALWQ